jgi:hypothetical protein
LLSWAGYLVEFVSMLVQVALVVMAFGVDSGTVGADRGFAKMGLAMLIVASLFLVVPATLVAMGRAGAALFHTRSSLASFAFHALATLAPLVSYPLMLYQHPPRPPAEESAPERSAPPPKRNPSQSDLRIEGAEWAINNGIVRHEDCKSRGEPQAFVEGCEARARWNAARVAPR